MGPESASVAVALRGYELWNSDGISAQVEHIWAPDVVFHEFAEMPDTGTWRGAEAVAARLQEQIDSIGEFKMELHAIEGRGPYVLATFDVIGKGAKSEVVVRDRFQHVLRIDGKRVSEIRAYMGTQAGTAEFERLTGPGD